MTPTRLILRFSLQVSTIVQYRTVDFGMEACELVLSIPELGAPLEDHGSFAMHPGSRFDVFRLAATHPVDPLTLTYRNKPARADKVATLEAHENQNQDIVTHRFPCPSASLHVFEIACTQGEECLLDVWSSQNMTYGEPYLADS